MKRIDGIYQVSRGVRLDRLIEESRLEYMTLLDLANQLVWPEPVFFTLERIRRG